MFEITPLQPDHLLSVLKDPLNEDQGEWPTNKIVYMCKQPYSFTGLVGNDVVICGGLVEYWTNRAHLWTLFSKNYLKHPVACFRGMKSFLECQPFNRVEMDTPTDLDIAHRRAKLLGFQLECRIARHYNEIGEDRSLYSWVRDQ